MQNKPLEKKSENKKGNPRYPADLPQPERTDEDPDLRMIRYLLSFPPNKRTNFLRIPLPNGGSAI